MPGKSILSERIALEQEKFPIPLLILEEWTARLLLNANRRGPSQIVILNKNNSIPTEFECMVDWTVSSEEELAKIKSKSVSPSPAEVGHGASPLVQIPAIQGISALFLDRDGIINVDHGYVSKPEQIQLMPGIAKLIGRANHFKPAPWDVAVVTNQSGIGRGLYLEESFHRVMETISQLLMVDQAKLDHIEYSTYFPTSSNEEYLFNRHLRKPRPGMIHQAAALRGIDLEKSILIGDRATDLMAGVLAGVGRIFLFTTEQSAEEWQIFQTWVQTLQNKHGLHDLLKNVSVEVITSFDEVILK